MIGIKRGKSFGQDVTLKFEGLPSGVTIDQAGAQITRDKEETHLTLTATNAAALGEYEIKVLGHPTTGGPASNTFKITVERKETFTVSVPTFSTPSNRESPRPSRSASNVKRISTRT